MFVASDPSSRRLKRTRRSEAAFTFAEILAAMFFLAMVIPVALQGIRISSDAGTLASRKSTATRLGDSMLNELMITDQWRSGSTSGQFDPPNDQYRWEIESQAWTEPGMTELSIRVFYPMRDQEFEILLTSLVSEEEDTSDQEEQVAQ